tara:strand:+ start:92431 stop:94440 length:2010 start_codon:yes stop_codon:yes gene_type:complete
MPTLLYSVISYQHTLKPAIGLFCLLLLAPAVLTLAVWAPEVWAQAPHYGTNITEQRSLYLQAQDALAQGQNRNYRALRARLNDYPLAQYLDYADISQRLANLPFADIDAFLRDNAGSYLAARLEREWLSVLASEERWEAVVQYHNPQNSHTTLTCQAHRARLALGDTSQLHEVGDLWNVARSQPNDCDPVFAAWIAAGQLTPDIAWQRFSKNIQARNRSLARYIMTLMPEREQVLAELYLRVDSQPELLRNLDGFSASEPEMPEIILHGVRRLANIDAPQAMLRLHSHHQQHNFSAQDMLDAQRYIAMRLLVQGFDDETESLLRNTPELATESLVSWLLRDALRNQDWPRLLRLIDQLPAGDQQSERWQYWRARALTQRPGGENSELANTIYQTLSLNRSFYGFLAADLLGKPYNMIDLPVDVSSDETDALYNTPAIVRAHELFHIGDEINARNEWQHANVAMTPRQVAASGQLAYNWGWHRNTIQAMIRLQHWDDLSLRFPLAYGDLFSSAASQLQIPTQLLYAMTRQESAFMQDVVSPAGARGLMQLMPATAREVARGVGLRISNQDLFTPEINISLGSQYLARLLEEFDGNRILAIAAYNAGPNRVNQWLLRSVDSPLPPDIWIETIPFAETRGYVQNVLVYAVIYGHRMNQPTAFLSPAEAARQL